MDATTFNEHYIRLHMLEVKVGTFVLRNVFEDIVKQSSADGDVKKYIDMFKDDIPNKKSRNSSEYKCLYPSNGDPTDESSWDLSLLAFVLINCCTLEGQFKLKKKVRNPTEILNQEVWNVKGRKLCKFLSEKQDDIDKMQKDSWITEEQYAILFPPNPQTNKTKGWSIELLLLVLFKLGNNDTVKKTRQACEEVVQRACEIDNTRINLDDFLKKKRNTFNQLNLDRKLTDDQYRQLFPLAEGGKGRSDMTLWDNHVLRIATVTVCQGLPHHWVDAINLFREMRKKLGAHAQDTEIDNTDFSKMWLDLENAISILLEGVPHIKTQVDETIATLKNGPLDIQSSLCVLKECYAKYDTKYKHILARLSEMDGKLEEIFSSVDNLRSGLLTELRKMNKTLEARLSSIDGKIDTMICETNKTPNLPEQDSSEGEASAVI